MRCWRFGVAPRREERAYPATSIRLESKECDNHSRKSAYLRRERNAGSSWVCERRATLAQRQRFATLRAELWRATGSVAPQSQSALTMLLRRALPVPRQNSAHPFLFIRWVLKSRGQLQAVCGSGCACFARARSCSRRTMAFSFPPRSRNKHVRYIQVSNTMIDARAR